MSDSKRVSVGIVAADPVRALGLETILRDDLAIAPRVCELSSAIADRNLDALVLDDRFDGEDVIATLSYLRRERPELKLIVLGEASDPPYVEAVIGAGAHGYLLETTTEAEIRMALDVVLKGSVWAPRKILDRLIDVNGIPHASGDAAEGLSIRKKMTPREQGVLELLLEGKSNREIGHALGIDEVTVKAHLGRMLRKTHSKNRVELTLRALGERQVAQQSAAEV